MPLRAAPRRSAPLRGGAPRQPLRGVRRSAASVASRGTGGPSSRTDPVHTGFPSEARKRGLRVGSLRAPRARARARAATSFPIFLIFFVIFCFAGEVIFLLLSMLLVSVVAERGWPPLSFWVTGGSNPTVATFFVRGFEITLFFGVSGKNFLPFFPCSCDVVRPLGRKEGKEGRKEGKRGV